MRAERSHTGARIARLALGILALAVGGCSNTETPVYGTRFDAFASAVDLRILGMPEPVAAAAARAIEQDFHILDAGLSVSHPGPMLRVNELLATGERFAAPPLLLPLLRQTQELNARTDGLFNPALGLLLDLWGFQDPSGRCPPPPSTDALRRVVAAAPTPAAIAIDDIRLISDNAAVKLDFGATAKAFAMELAMTQLRAQGVRAAMIEVGGDQRVIGDRAGQPWRLPIRRPSGVGVLGMLNVSGNASVFTASAAPHECSLAEGRPLHRLIDPRTGYPATSTLLVTVLHDGDAVTAAAASMALFVAGPQRWEEIAQRLDLRFALLVAEDGTVHLSPEMARRLEILDQNARVLVSQAWNAPVPDS